MNVITNVLDAVPDAMVVAGKDGVIRYANGAAESLFRFPAGALKGTALRDLLPEGSRPSHLDLLRLFFDAPTKRAMGSGRLLLARRADGTEFPADISLAPLIDHAEPLAAAAVRDMTAVLTQQRTTAEILRVAKMGTWTMDLADDSTHLSREFLDLLGLSEAPADRAERLRLLHPGDAARWELALTTLVDTGVPQLVSNLRVRHAKGEHRHLDVTMYLESDVAGRPRYAHGISMDVTERVKLEGAERDAREQLWTADRLASLGLLAASLAHEINNPLTVVVGGLLVAANDLNELKGSIPADALEEMHAAIRDGREAAEQVCSIVKDLRIFSRDDTRARPVDVVATLNAAIRMARNEIRHRATLEMDLQPVPPVLGFESRLSQALLNLLVNAAQAIPEGNAANNFIRVKVRHLVEAQQVEINVEDTGGGISPEVMPSLFTPFVTTKSEGTGLGLAISRRIARELGGDLTVEQAHGTGAAFSLRLPALVHKHEETGVPAKQSAHAPAASILLLDDDDAVRQAIIRVLRGHHRIRATRHAREALTWLGNGERFDAILCDLMMPEMTGSDFVRALREIAPDQAARVVFVTGGPFTAWARRALESLPNRSLQKPFKPEELLLVIEELLAAPA